VYFIVCLCSPADFFFFFFFFAAVPEDSIYRKDPTYLWRDVLQIHSTFPMHVMVGGGDQVYSDSVFEESAALKEWAELNQR
jgi:hypothetical protein